MIVSKKTTKERKLVAVIPSKQTFYLIAASEAGGTVVQTPEAKKMLLSLSEVIQKNLDELNKPKN